MIKDENFIHISGWMINRLGLSGNDLLVYAIIYGFSQDGEPWFHGSRKYLAEFIGIAERSIDRIIDRLVTSGFLKKDNVKSCGVTYCRYMAIDKRDSEMSQMSHPLTKCRPGGDKMSGNNIVDNKDLSLSSACAHEEKTEEPPKQEPAENHPSGPKDVVEFAAKCGVPITTAQAEIFIAKNSVTAQGNTWMLNRVPVRNWRAIAQIWLPNWRQDFLDGKKTETVSTTPAEPEDEYQKKRCPALEAKGYKWIPQEKRYETWSEMEKRTSFGINPYNLK